MTVIERIRHRAAICGHVVDAVSRAPIDRALVRLVSPEREVRTRADGFYFFADLPDGTYALHASAPEQGSRYAAADVAAVTVGSTVAGTPALDPRGEIVLAPTGLVGVVRRAADAAPVPFAELRLRATGDRAVCDKDGRYALSPVQAGTQGVSVSAPGFVAVSPSVTLVAGQQTTADFSLTHS